MTATFTLTLDTTPPSNPLLEIDYGVTVTGSRLVTVRLSSADADLELMKVWGDVDPTADGNIQIAEEDSEWIPHAHYFVVMLSAGDGHKTLSARLQDDVCNITLPVSKTIVLDSAVPVVEITEGVTRERISKQAPCDVASFTWRSNMAFDAYQVRVVPSRAAPQSLGVVIPAGTSVNVQGEGLWQAGDLITTEVYGADLEVASPGDTPKVVKVFVRSTEGRWSV